MSKLRTMTLVAAAVLLMFTATASAATVNSLINTGGSDPSDMNYADDLNIEYLATDGGTVGTLDVGDVIRGAINFHELWSGSPSGSNLGGSTGNSQWAGVFSIKVRDILNIHTDAGGTLRGDIIFEADPGFAAWVPSLDIDGLGTSPDGPAVAAGSVARLWETPPPPTIGLASTGSPDDSVANFAQGDFYWDIGFADGSAASHRDAGADTILGTADDIIVSTNGEGWVSRAGGLVVSGITLGPADEVGASLFALAVLQSGLNPEITPHKLTTSEIGALGATVGDVAQITGSSTVSGPTTDQAAQGFDLSSGTRIAFLAVPLPAAIWPGAVLLLGFGAVRRRRRRRA